MAELIQWQVGPLSDKEAKSGIPPLTLLPDFALTRVLTHRERSVPNQFFLQAFVLCSHSKFAQSRLKCTRYPQESQPLDRCSRELVSPNAVLSAALTVQILEGSADFSQKKKSPWQKGE